MRARRPKRRNAWLITWEAVPSYRLKDLGRPRVVAILKPQISDSTIKKVLPVLFTSESRLTFSEKIDVSFFAQQAFSLHKDFNGRFSWGKNPHLWARRGCLGSPDAALDRAGEIRRRTGNPAHF